jgi:ketosteroid isomerase-like protein
VSSVNREAVRQLHDPDESGRLQRHPLFELLDEEVEWHAIGPTDLFPWAGTHRGHDGVRRWFDLLNAAMAYERFELLELYSDEDTVVEVIAAAGKARTTGAPFASEVVRAGPSGMARPSASGRTTTPMATPRRCSGRRPASSTTCNRRPLRRLTSRARAAEGQQTLEIEPAQSCKITYQKPPGPHQ